MKSHFPKKEMKYECCLKFQLSWSPAEVVPEFEIRRDAMYNRDSLGIICHLYALKPIL